MVRGLCSNCEMRNYFAVLKVLVAFIPLFRKFHESGFSCIVSLLRDHSSNNKKNICTNEHYVGKQFLNRLYHAVGIKFGKRYLRGLLTGSLLSAT